MNKYHKELQELSEILHKFPLGYGCGNCWECDEMYEKSMKIINKIIRKRRK